VQRERRRRWLRVAVAILAVGAMAWLIAANRHTLDESLSLCWYFATIQSGSCTNSSAEWIAEAPSSCGFTCRVLPLANFGTMNFSNCTANGATIGSYGSSVWQEITMTTSGGTVKAQPSALNGSGNGFSDTWHHS
jgi:hypothetical protein